MNDLFLCIVLYKTNLSSSRTVLSLEQINIEIKKRIKKIYLWDNSPNKILSAEIFRFKERLGVDIDYLWDGKNNALSKIYNTTISFIPRNSVLILLDHDSCITNIYFEKLLSDVKKFPQINLFIPKIRYNNQLVSPAKQFYFYGQYLKKVDSGIIKSKYKMAINSGMAIRSNYLKDSFDGYNEDIRFYGTDNDFMYKYSQKNKYFKTLDCTINHELNYYENHDPKDVLRRMNDMKNGSLTLMRSINIFIYILACLYWWLYSIKTKIKIKKLR